MRGAAELDTAAVILARPEVAAALLAGMLVIGALCWLGAGALGWSRTAAALAGAGLALALAVTLARPGVLGPPATGNPLAACLAEPFSVAGTSNRLNLVMLMPFAFFATVASGRPLSVLLCAGLLSVGIEVFQAYTGVGVCESNDVFTNTLGAGLAVLAGWLCVLALSSRRRGAPVHER